MHFDEYPLSRDLFNIDEEQVEGEKFKDWKECANYSVTATIVIQVDGTNVTPKEKAIAPNMTAVINNKAFVNIYKIWHRRNVSFNEFQAYYALREASLDNYVESLVSRLNTARHEGGKFGEWYINYSLNDRHIRVRKPIE